MRGDKALVVAARATAAIYGACIGALIVAVPAAIIWGHHGPDWPLAILFPLAGVGAAVGLYGTRNVRL